MVVVTYDRVYGLLERYAAGVDAFGVMPLPDLSGAFEHAIGRLKGGLIPAGYGWTWEKTHSAYTYGTYGRWARSIVIAAKYYHTDEQYPDSEGRTVPGSMHSQE